MQKELERLVSKDSDLIKELTSVNENVEFGKHQHSGGTLHTVVIPISPTLAESLLLRNFSNRQLSKNRVQYLAEQMVKGRWMVNGESIIFDTNGELRNGQHRLNAIIASNTTQEMVVVTGVEVDAFATMDLGGKRNGGDVLSIMGVEDPKSVSTLCKFVYGYKNAMYDDSLNGAKTVGNTEIYGYYKSLTNVRSSIDFAIKLRKDKSVPTRVLSTQQLHGFHYLLSEVNKVDAERFLNGLYYGNELEMDSPIMAMRNRLIKSKDHKNYRIGNKEFINLMTLAWNKWRAGEKVKNLRLPKNLKGFVLELN